MRTREWIINAADYEDEESFRDAVARELAGLENIGHREGGAFVATPIRVELPSRMPPVREFETQAWLFKHEFMPAARRAEAPAPDPPAPEAADLPAGDA